MTSVAVDNEELHQNTRLEYRLEEEEHGIGFEEPIVKEEEHDQDTGVEDQIVK